MDDVEGLSEAAVDRILAGRAPADEDTTGLGRFAQDLRTAYTAAPPKAVEEKHLAAIVDAARLHTDRPQPSVSPARAGLAALLPTWRRKAVFSGLFGSLAAKIVTGTVAAVAATGGLAAGNLLPAPIQQVVADAAGAVGIHLPSPDGQGGSLAAAPDLDDVAEAADMIDALVQQVTAGAELPHEVGLPVAEAAQACAEQVSAIAGDLADEAAEASSPEDALSLARRVGAIAQEAVGCALPKPVGAGLPAAVGGQIASVTSGAESIVEAVVGCADELKPAILQLVESAATSMDPSAVLEFATKAGSVAGSAEECARSVGTAAQTAFALPLPVQVPVTTKLPVAKPSVPSLAVPLPLPGVTAPEPATAPAPAPQPAPAPATPSWWNMMPGYPTDPGAWMGMTGSWGNFGQWMPFQPAPEQSNG